jgi:uncharacterized protein YdgA (DUF945 family)
MNTLDRQYTDLLNEVYKNYWGKVSVNNEEDCLVKQEEGSLLKEVRVLYQQEFINKCKTDPEFSEKWGLTIEERELNLDERLELLKKLEIFQERVIDNAKSEMIHSLADSHSIPTKLITISYNDKTIESYE